MSKSYDITYERITKAEITTNDKTEAVDVVKFVSFAANLIEKHYGADWFDNKEKYELVSYLLIGNYTLIVWNAQELKKEIPAIGSINYGSDEINHRTGKHITWPIQDVDNFLEVEINADSLFFAMIKGTEKTSVRSQILTHTDSADNEYSYMILTHKLACAVITILMSVYGMAKQVPAAKLGANIFAGCTVPSCQANNWGIHGHSGINFVSSFSLAVYNTNEAKGKGLGAEYLKSCDLPALGYLWIAAWLMDEHSNNKEIKEKNATLTSVLQATGTDFEFYKKVISDLYKPEQWNVRAVSGKQNVAAMIAKAMREKKNKTSEKTVEGPKKTPEGPKKYVKFNF